MTITFAPLRQPDLAALLSRLRAELATATTWVEQHHLEPTGLCRCLRTDCQAAQRARLWQAHLQHRIDYYDDDAAINSPTMLLPLVQR
jgi:hypothetical protein